MLFRSRFPFTHRTAPHRTAIFEPARPVFPPPPFCVDCTSPMRLLTPLGALALLSSSTTLLAAAQLNIEVTKPVDCTRKTENGDTISVNYRGTLESDGSEFDSSYKRNKPFMFKLGIGQVIAGWDQGLLGMCIGEGRKLTIPPALAYGNSQVGTIPAGSTLGMWFCLHGLAIGLGET